MKHINTRGGSRQLSLVRPLGNLKIYKIIHICTNEYQKIEDKLLSQSMS